MSSIQDRLNAMKQGTKTASAQKTGGTAKRIEQGSIEERLAKAREDSKNINGWGGTAATPAADKFQRETSRWTSDGGGRKSTARRMEDIQADLDAANSRRKQLQMEESILLAPDAMAPNDERLAEVRSALEDLAREVTALDTEKYVEGLYSTPGHRDSFTGQFDANLELGRLSQDQGRAWNAYLDDPSDINRKQAELQDEALRAFLLRNGAALDDEGAVAPMLSQDLANYLPQFVDQKKAELGGAIVGGLGAGLLTGGVGTLKGIQAGSMLASGQQMFEVTRGAAYKRFIDMGVDDELARALAQDEGIVNGIIESGDTGLDWLMLGGSKALTALLPGLAGKATTVLGKTALAQLWNKVPGSAKAVGGYLLNIGQEGGEEGWQEGVSIANDKRALAGENSGLWELAKASVDEALAKENRDRVLEAAKSGMKIAAMMGGAQALGNQVLAYGLGRGNRPEAPSPAGGEAVSPIDSKVRDGDLPAGQNPPAELDEAARETTSEGNSMGRPEMGAEGLKMASEGIGAEEATPELMTDLQKAVEERMNDVAEVRGMGVETDYDKMKSQTDHGQMAVGQTAIGQRFYIQPKSDGTFTAYVEDEFAESGMARNEFEREYDSFDAAYRGILEHLYSKDEEGTRKMARYYDERVGVQAPPSPAEQSAYDAGKAGVRRSDVELVTEAQEQAFEAGQRDRIMSASDADLAVENRRDEAYTGINKMEGTNYGTEEVHLRDGSQRIGSANPGGEVSAVEGSTGRDQSWQAQSVAADRGAASLTYGKAVSASSLGIAGGSQVENIRIVTGGDTEFTRKAKAVAKQRGLRLVLFAGSNLEIRQEVDGKTITISARAYVSGDRVFVRVDHPLYTSDQLMRHEAGHDMIDRGEINPDDVRKRLADKYGEAGVQQIANMYVEAYEGTELSPDEIWVEAICDSLGDMNIFAKTASEQAAHEMLTETKKAATDTEAEKTRGPPTEEGKMSRDFPPYNFSQSDANERAARWAHEQDVKNGDQRLFSYHGKWYLVEADDSADLGYRIVEGLNDRQYKSYVKELNENGNVRGVQEGFDRVGELDRRGDWAGRGKRGADSSPAEQRGENLSLRGVGTKQNGKRETASDRSGNLQGSRAGGESVNAPTASYLEKRDAAKRLQQLNKKRSKGKLTESEKQERAEIKEKYHFSRELDVDYMAAVDRGDTEMAQKMVDDAAKVAGYTVKAYHGTARSDRVGYVFLPERATSGPMAFFTDSREIAENYARDKADTSLAYDEEYSDYYSQFRVNKNGKSIKVQDLWRSLPFAEKQRLKEAGKHITWDDDMENIVWDDDATRGLGNWDAYTLNEHKGNAIEALIDCWLESGELYNNEGDFVRVLELAGIKGVEYRDPDARYEKVYDAYLKIQKPFNTATIDESFASGFEEWYSQQPAGKYNRVTAAADMWDKNNQTAEKFIERVRSDIASGTSYAWTSIPDSATDYLKHLGHDGIQDTGGKNGGEIHTVWIPFSSEQVKSADAVARDDNGNVIPLSERFNSGNKDIRYSRELDSVNALREQNEALQEKVDYWKGQTKRTTQPTLRKDDVEKLAKNIINKYDGVLEASEISGELKELGEFILRGGDPDADLWAGVKDRSMSIARQIVNSAQVLTNEEVLQDYKKIKTYLRNHPLAFNDKSDIADFNDFRKRNMGRFIISKDGTPVDSEWAKLQEMFGESYFPSAIDHPAAQLQHIADLFDNMESIFENPYSFRMAEATEYVANDIVDSLFSDELRLTPPTFADRQAEKLDKQKAKDKERLERLRQQKNDRIAEIRKEGQKRTREAVKAIRADRDAKIAEMKKYSQEKASKDRENRKAKELRERIRRHANDLSQKLINGSDKKHIPQELQGTVAKLLECINLESNYTYDPQTRTYKKDDAGLPTRRTKAFAALKREYEKLANELTIDPDLMGEDGLLSDVIDLADKRLVDMNSTELETVWMAVRSIEMTVLNANRSFSNARWETISDAAEALRQDNIGKALKTEYNGGLGKAQQLTGLDMMTPEAYLHRLGNTGDAMFRIMRDAQDEHIRMMKAVSDFTHENLKDVDVNKLEKAMHTVILGGEEVKLSTAQLMELHVLMRRQQAQEHIMLGGILPDVVSNKGIKKISRAEPVRGVTLEEINKALSLLSADEVAVAEKLQEFASTTLSDYGNQASMKVYNYEKFNEKNYWPIRSNRQEIRSDVQKDTAVTSVANRGFTKGTKPHANTSVRLGSIFDTFSTHSSEMATYAAWLGASEDINRIRNYTFRNEQGERTGTVKGIIERVHGSRGTDYLQKLLADIANGIKGTHGETQFMSSLVGNYKAASVGSNLRVVIQQPTAILRALDMLDPQYLVAGLKPAGGWKKAMKYAPIAQWKDWGYFDINTGRQMKDVLFDSDSAVNKVKNASMWGAGKMDSLSWGLLWNAVETEVKVKQKNLKPGTKDFYDAVAKRFTEIVDHTQVVDGILQRSQIMRSSDGLTKMATSFMGEPTKQYNMLLSAAYDAKHSPKAGRKAAKARLARAAVTLAISGVANAMMQSIMDAVRDDDKEKEYWEKWRNHLFGFTGEEEGIKDHVDAFFAGNLGNTVNPAAYIPYVKDVLSILQGYDVSRMDMESVEKTITASQNMIKALNGDGKHTIGGASANLFAEVARLVGIPVANLKREIKSFAMLYAIESDNYLMQYRMEKASLDLNYSSNSTTFLDILYNAYTNDQAAYKLIYADMVNGGYGEEKIQNGMESRMKKAQGVKKAEELEQRYLAPSLQTSYDKTMKSVQSSSVWRGATAAQRDHLEDNLYDLVIGNSDGKKMQEKIDEGKPHGISETEYLLYKLALEMADQPSKSGKYGSYTNAEVEAAIESLNLSDKESSYLWLAQGKNEKSNPWG